MESNNPVSRKAAPETSASLAYQELSPNEILAAVESIGLHCDGRLLTLNSYENRVYRVGVEGGRPVVPKFYRPGRWSDAAIREEHAFTIELAEQEIPVAAPLADARRRDPASSRRIPLCGLPLFRRPRARARRSSTAAPAGPLRGAHPQLRPAG